MPDHTEKEALPMSQSDATRDEKSRRRAMLIRASIYIAGTHLFAGFVLLLFYLGGRGH